MCLRDFFSSSSLLKTVVFLTIMPQIYLAGQATENSIARWVSCNARFDLVSSTKITCVEYYDVRAILLKCPRPIKNCRRKGDIHNLVADPEGAINPTRFKWNSTACENPFFDPKWKPPTAITKYFRYPKTYEIYVLEKNNIQKGFRCDKQNNTDSVECYANPKDMKQCQFVINNP